MMPLEFLISFVLPLQVDFGGVGEGGESGGQGKISGSKKILMCGKNLHTCSAPAPCAIHKACLKALYFLLIQPRILPEGKKGRKYHLGKKKKNLNR